MGDGAERADGRGVDGGRGAVLAQLLARIRAVGPERRVLIGLDGYDGVGKSCLSYELREAADGDGGRPLIGISIDGFHRPRGERRQAGAGPEGFYRGSYQDDVFRKSVVDPLRSGEPIIPAVWDVAQDVAVAAAPVDVPPRGVVVIDGIFLHRPGLRDGWDATVWVDAPFSVTVPRGNARFPGAHDRDPEARANHRYVGGQRLYEAECSPRERATWVLDNADLERPVLLR